MRAVVYLLFLLSGATGLVYEVAWTRRLVLVLGSTTRAVSLILAAYMLGLALGARLFGGRADRLRRPLLAYAILEAGVGALAFLFPWLLAGASGLALALGGGPVASFVLCFVVLLLPTILMGGTLPVLSRFVVTRIEGLGGRIGVLYGLNTFGAVAGTFLSGFVLVEALGVYGSTYAAGAANLLIAAAAFLLARRAGAGAEAATAPAGPDPEPAGPGAPVRLALAAAFAAGFLSLASEVLWTRMLTFFLEGFTWTFSAMLTTFLLGLALGTVVSGALVNRLKRLRAYVGILFLLSSLVSAGVLFVLTRNYEVVKWAKDVTATWFDPERWRYHHAASLFLASFVTLFVPALVMGGIFPAVVRMATRSLAEVGRKVGTVYAVNTAGAVLGSLLAGLVLIPTVGMAPGAVTLAGLAAVAGVLLLSGRARLLALPVAAGAVLLVIAARPGDPFILRSHVFRGERGLERRLDSYEEGAYAAVSVVRDVRNGVRAIYTDEFQAAATGPNYKYMRMLAHLPLLVAPKEEGADVLVICFGTGTTAGSASVHPLGRLDLVEICPEVIEQAPAFRDVNRGVLEPDPDRPFPVDLHVTDGRNFLLRSDRKWDVITLEPLMPYTPGAVNLYTKDFYELGRRHLVEGGVMCQWIPIHAMSSDDYRMLLRSFVEVFPESTLYCVEETSLVIGTTAPGGIPLARVAERMRRPGVAEDLGEIEYDDPLLVLNTFVSGGADLRAELSGARIMTDEHPYMEFRPAPYGWPNTFGAANLALFYNMRKPVLGALDLTGVPEEARAEMAETLDRYFRATQFFLEAQYKNSLAGFYDAVKDREKQQQFFRESLAAYEEAVRLNPDDASARYLHANAVYGYRISLGILQLRQGQTEAAVETFRTAAAMGNPFKPDLAYLWLGRALNRMERPARAFEALEEALRRFPGSPDALAERGYARFLLGDFRAAEADFEEALSSPVAPEMDAPLKAAWKRLGNLAEKGLLPERKAADEEIAALVETVRGGSAEERREALPRLRVLVADDAAAFRRVLAPDVAKAKDPAASAEEARFALDLMASVGDVAGTLELLTEGTVGVRERAADLLSYAREKEVLPALIEAMADPDAEVREAAMASFFGLTGKAPDGYDPRGPEEARAAALLKLRAWWEVAGSGFRFRER